MIGDIHDSGRKTGLAPAAPVEKRPYQTPTLLALGDIRDLTLGASPGRGDSGGNTNFKCHGCP